MMGHVGIQVLFSGYSENVTNQRAGPNPGAARFQFATRSSALFPFTLPTPLLKYLILSYSLGSEEQT